MNMHEQTNKCLYLRLASVSEVEVDEIIKRNPSISIEQAENLVIQRQLIYKATSYYEI